MGSGGGLAIMVKKVQVYPWTLTIGRFVTFASSQPAESCAHMNPYFDKYAVDNRINKG